MMKKTMIIELATFVLGTAFWAGLSFGAEQKQELRLSNTGARDGSNCIDYSVNVSWVFSPDVTLSCSANYSQATTVLRKIQEGNEFWLSLRMTHQF
ncbi:MAG: hypothetical protein RR719_01485 [Akkermansia sp.]